MVEDLLSKRVFYMSIADSRKPKRGKMERKITEAQSDKKAGKFNQSGDSNQKKETVKKRKPRRQRQKRERINETF